MPDQQDYDKFGTLNDRVIEENPIMRRSNSKMRFEQAKEIDGAINPKHTD